MDTILSRCVMLANLPTNCSRSMLEMVLENAPGENQNLDQQIEDAQQLDAKTWLILFLSKEDGEHCLDKRAMDWVFETANECCNISPTRACMQDVPAEWINSDELLNEQQTHSPTAQEEMDEKLKEFTPQKKPPPTSTTQIETDQPHFLTRQTQIQPVYVIVPPNQDVFDALQTGAFQQALVPSPNRANTFTYNGRMLENTTAYEHMDGLERPVENKEPVYTEILEDSDSDTEIEASAQRRPVPSPRRKVRRASPDTEQSPPTLPPRPVSERKHTPPSGTDYNRKHASAGDDRRTCRYWQRVFDSCDSRSMKSQFDDTKCSSMVDSLDRQIVVDGVKTNTYELLDHFMEKNIISDIDIVEVFDRPIWHEAILVCLNHKVANRILHAINEGEQMSIDGSILTAILHKDYPYDNNKILITGLSESSTADEISHEIGMLMNRKPTQVTMCQNSALVSLNTTVDMRQIEHLNEKCLERGSVFTVSPVRQSLSIKVSCADPHIIPGAVREYFEGVHGNITEMIYRETNEFIISFKSQFDLEELLTQEVHMIGGHDVHVSIYYSCLDVAANIPPPFLYAISPYLRRYIQRSDHYRRDSMDILGRHNGKIIWPCLNDPVDYVQISCTKAYTGTRGKQGMKQWKQGCIFALNDICKRLDTKTVYVSKQAWKLAKSHIRKMALTDATDVELLPDDNCAVVVSGEMLKVKHAVDDIRKDVSRIENELEATKFDTIRVLKDHELDILKMLETTNVFPKSLTCTFEYRSLVLHGTSQDTNAAMDIVAKALSGIYEHIMQDLCDLSRSLLNCMETKEYIRQRLRDDHITCVFADILRQVHVFSKNEDESRKTVGTVNSLLKERIFQIDQRCREYFAGKEGEASLAKLEQKYSGLMKHRLATNQLTIVCVNKVYERISDSIKHIIDMQSDFLVVLNVDPGALKYIERYNQSSVDSIKERYENSTVPLTIKTFHRADMSIFEISGTKDQCKEARLSLIELCDTVMRKDLTVTWWSNLDQFLSSVDGVNTLTECEKMTQCVIKSPRHEVKTISTLLRCDLQSCCIEFTVQDLTEVQADCLVRPTTATFDFTSGLSQQILSKGGNDIQVECEKAAKRSGTIVTNSGLMQGKGIIHAVLDTSSADKSANDKAIRKFITICMSEADNMRYESIAFPIICGGYFGFPTEVCANSISAAIHHFWLETGLETTVKKVYLCDVEEEHVGCFAKHAKQYFKTTIISSDDSNSGPHENVKLGVYIIQGNLVEQEADAIVNVTNKRLDLNAGSLSKQLLKIGGSHIQTDCRTKYPKGLPSGEIARSTGGSLKCKELFHGVLEQWDEDNGYAEMVMRYFVSTCLMMAHKKGYMSIAFPALGCGLLQYPPDVTAKAMFEEVKKFRSDYPESPLLVVRFVILPTLTKMIQAFEECQAKLTITHGNTLRHSTEPKPARSFVVNAERGFANTIGPVTLYVRQGDITVVQTTAFVNAIGADIRLDVGNISRMVLAAAGDCIQHEAQDDIQRFKSTGLTVTSAGRLLHRHIIHVKSRNKVTSWKETIKKCLIEAEKLRLTSLSFPLVGTGCMGNDPDKIARAMVDTFSDYILGPEYKTYLKTIEIVVYKKEALDMIISEVASKINKRASVLPTIPDIFKHTDDVDGKQKLTFHIHGATVANVTKAVEFLDKLETETILNLPKGSTHIKEQINGLKRVGERHGVQIVVTNRDRVSVIGLGRPAKIIVERLRHEIDKNTKNEK